MIERDVLLREIKQCRTMLHKGKVVQLIGLVIESEGPNVMLGELCYVFSRGGGEPIKGSQTTTTTYAAADQPYAAIAAQQDGEERAAAELARLIRLDVMQALAAR